MHGAAGPEVRSDRSVFVERVWLLVYPIRIGLDAAVIYKGNQQLHFFLKTHEEVFGCEEHMKTRIPLTLFAYKPHYSSCVGFSHAYSHHSKLTHHDGYGYRCGDALE